ncbi:LANO_0D07206g1_1 [Lachancea nothofagi CBS 11611]|uniref:ATP-dependent DNA helicase II subunit 2 n=1 Tax=Lachancea nothofagi CBS 11611 TaxID=1266666 RepID=A0A1G4JI32_9SACH|nr:LANO_0D07206g1_1 [Lachancea nothofagi CBS 11611]
MGSEATTFILDVSPSMINMGYTEQAFAYLEYVLFMKAKKQRKTDWISCFLANCAETRNNHETDNVFELLPFTAPISSSRIIEALRELQRVIDQDVKQQTRVNSMVQSLLVSSVSMRDEFKKRKIRKQIMVFTDDLNGLDMTDEELRTLEQEMDCRIVLVICGVKEEESKTLGNTTWEKCIEIIPGSVQTTMTQLLQEITTPIPATVKPVRVFQGSLRLGAPIADAKDVKQEHDSISIKVEGYPATKAVSSLNRRVVAKADDGRYEPVKSIIEYEAIDHISDDEGDNDADQHGDHHDTPTVSVARDSVKKAYRYGSAYVVLPQAIESERIYHTTPGLDIRGFVGRDDIPRHFLNSESTFIVPSTRDGTRADSFALAALVDSMIRLDKLAIARYVQKCDSEVQMCVLCPLLVSKKRKSSGDTSSYMHALVLSRLPFAEDERVSDYPKLRNSASDGTPQTTEIDALMSDFIDSRDLGQGPKTTWCSTPLYQSLNSTAEATDPTLPIPMEGITDTPRECDVSAVPAIGIHRQQQILIEYMHQRIVRGSENFEMPDLPAVYKCLLNPSHDSDKDSTKRLQELLAIKINTSKSSSVDAMDEQQEDDEQFDIPSLESLLARGRA